MTPVSDVATDPFVITFCSVAPENTNESYSNFSFNRRIVMHGYIHDASMSKDMPLTSSF